MTHTQTGMCRVNDSDHCLNLRLTLIRWDPQERRNYGETVHEDNDILGIFSTEEYTHFKPGWGAVLLGTFVASVGVLCGVVYRYYPDRVRSSQPTVDLIGTY